MLNARAFLPLRLPAKAAVVTLLSERKFREKGS